MRAPASTYRLQLQAGFGWSAVDEIVEYLERLGVDWLYLSPVLAARPGSTHGYDCVDPTRLNPELGSEEEFMRLAQRLAADGHGLMLDIVPNHLAAHELNPWWLDVLEHGKKSQFARVFDIDWELGGGRVLLPVLGDELDAVVQRGELAVERDGEKLWLRYFEHRLPLRDPDGLVSHAPEAPDADTLGRLLPVQAYELRYWRAERPLNYRRFFTIGDLVGVRVEDDQVFQWTHRKVLEWMRDGFVQGLRVDHPDGLRDPAGYLERLAKATNRAYVVVEKILTGTEKLREDWQVDGATGYEQLNLIARLFVDPASEAALYELYQAFTGRTRSLREVVVRSKRLVLQSSLAPEIDAVARRAHALCRELSSDPSLEALRAALVETVAWFDVYRSYVRPGATEVVGEDRRLIERALREARAHADLAPAAFQRLSSLLLLEPPLARDADTRERALDVLLRFQQLTGPAAAKGVEDTAFYRFHPLASLAEVGGEPDAFGIGVAAFHEHNAARARRWPHALSASSTHDTKRGEDVRARISVLSEIPQRWAQAVQDFARMNRRHKAEHAGQLAPDANDEYLIYQSLVGSFPFDGAVDAEYRQRIEAYALKAIRESKRYTRWTAQDEGYEAAMLAFVRGLLETKPDNEFPERLRAFVAPLVRPGLLGALSQLLLKLATPGAADFYQGTELWDDSLVDPDNRRPIAFDARIRLLAELERGVDARVLFDELEDGRLKLWITSRGLRWRCEQPELFTSGEYHAASVSGSRAEQVVALVRRHGEHGAIAACGRFFTRFGDASPLGTAWSDTVVELAPALAGEYEDVLTGARYSLGGQGRLAASELFARLPVALLRRRT